MRTIRKICIPSERGGVGGPASFQKKLITGLTKKNVEVTYDLKDTPYDAVLVINATRHLGDLWRCKKKGIPIVQRLGGLNYRHRHIPLGLRNSFLAEFRNVAMAFVRSFVADQIVYQSQFAADWWAKRFGRSTKKEHVIYNGVDLFQFSPQGEKYQSEADVSVISVEGNQVDRFAMPVDLPRALNEHDLKSELLIFGNLSAKMKHDLAKYPFVHFRGVVSNSELPFFHRGAKFYVLTDVFGGCPNSVIEALACGTPVIGYHFGVLPEMLTESAGRCVQPTGNPWRCEVLGNIEGLCKAAREVVENWEHFHRNARRLAEERYSLERMVNNYWEVLAQ